MCYWSLNSAERNRPLNLNAFIQDFPYNYLWFRLLAIKEYILIFSWLQINQFARAVIFILTFQIFSPKLGLILMVVYKSFLPIHISLLSEAQIYKYLKITQPQIAKRIWRIAHSD